MKNLNKTSIIFSFSILLAGGNIFAQSKEQQFPTEEKKEKKKSDLEIKDNSKSLDTKSDKAMEIYLQTPVVPNQSITSKTEERPRTSAPR